jgi:hypothetical protein
MTRIQALCFLAAVFQGAGGCSTRPSEEGPDYVPLESEATSANAARARDDDRPAAGGPAAASDDEPSGEGLEAAAPVDPGPPEEALDGGADGGAPEPGDGGAPTDGGGAPALPIAKSGACTSTSAGHRSVTKMTWDVIGQKVLIKSMTVTVSNVYGRDANDVDVWVRHPGGTEYKAFNSGDVLPSNATRKVRLPTNWTKPLGTRIRIETNFDKFLAFDPSASCSIAMVR